MSDQKIPDWPEASGVSADIGEIMSYIHELRKDLTSFLPSHSGGAHISGAREELGAVVAATEDAANTIMDACDAMSKAIKNSGPVDEQINAAISQIYQACSFQDLTSQRLTKVQRTLEVIEQRLSDVATKLGVDPDEVLQTAKPGRSHTDAGLMNGPALPGQGIDQSDIDNLFG